MNVNTGQVMMMADVARLDAEEQKLYKELGIPLTARQQRTMKIGRNDNCPCGSGKKFKKCCLGKPITE